LLTRGKNLLIEFMKHFDENGNFIPSSELYKEEELEEDDLKENQNLSHSQKLDFDWKSNHTLSNKK